MILCLRHPWCRRSIRDRVRQRWMQHPAVVGVIVTAGTLTYLIVGALLGYLLVVFLQEAWP